MKLPMKLPRHFHETSNETSETFPYPGDTLALAWYRHLSVLCFFSAALPKTPKHPGVYIKLLLSSMCAIFSPHRTLSNPDIFGDFRDFRRLRWMLNLLHCARRQSDVALAETLWQSWQKAVADADGTGCPAAEQEK